MKSTQERLSEVYSRLPDENHEAEMQQLREAAALAGYYGGVYLTHCYFGGLPKPSEYTFRASVNGMIRGEAGKYFEDELKGRGKTEIPFSHFIDLLKDSIEPWRLEEDGWEAHPFKVGDLHNHYTRPVPAQDYNLTVTFLFEKTSEHPYDYILPPNLQEVFICINKNSLPTCGSCGRVGTDTDYVTSFDGCKTYTDLLTLIRLIG